MDWLESWAKAVVRASKTDQSERLDAAAQRERKHHGGADEDASRGHGITEGRSIDTDSSTTVQARRRAMKAAVRERYAFSTAAQLWAEELAGGRPRE